MRLLSQSQLDSAPIAIGGCDTVPLNALRLISVALIKEQLGRFAVSSPSLVIPDSLLRAKVESEKQLVTGFSTRSPSSTTPIQEMF